MANVRLNATKLKVSLGILVFLPFQILGEPCDLLEILPRQNGSFLVVFLGVGFSDGNGDSESVIDLFTVPV